MGGSWASGMNLYLTMAILGIAHRMHWLVLPGDADILANPVVLTFAIIMFLIEFVADKIPYVDSAWDSVHTFIRPFGGAALGYLAMARAGPEWQIPVAVLTGSVAMESHLTKATARVAINTSPEPVSNSIASVTEDAAVVGIIYLVIKHPYIAAIVVAAFIIIAVWFLKMMFRFLKSVFQRIGKKPEPPSPAVPSKEV